IMYCIVEWKDFIQDPLSFLTSSGFVVYGGITGGIFAVFVYAKMKKVSFVDYLDLVLPAVALAQAFGRIGCFFAGCCYGRETDSCIGVTFHNSLYAPNGVKLIPTQLISSAADLLHMAILLFIAKRTQKKGTVSACYIIFYSVGRFFIEMLRNDDRGSVGSLSTSQFYGIFSLILGVVVFIIAQKHKEPEAEAVAVEASVEETKEDETV
ncbi:MAG: prolipoprotein diacylglyceryl transferase, partial [Lachnospiraceae bacterium]|nr:prolipoprotein diacylglyceryl transferase [Lachnospiraceae bacterium]